MIVAIAAEDRCAFENATTVGDAVGEALAFDTWRGASFQAARTWTGLRSQEYLELKRMNDEVDLAWGSRRRFHGRFDGEDARVRKAADLFDFHGISPKIMVFAIDNDRRPEVELGLRLAVESSRGRVGPVVVLASMCPEAQAWRICAFEPRNQADRKTHREIKKELKFDPVREPTKLVSTTTGIGLREVKPCHDRLFDGVDSNALLDRPITELESTAASSGMPAYIGDLRAALIAAGASLSGR